MTITNSLPGFRQFTGNPDPRYERFAKEYYKTRGKTNLLTDTTIEQMNSTRPDGTIVYTGFQSRGPYLNDGSIPEYLNVPLTILPIENRLKTEPRKETTNMNLTKVELERKQMEEINRPNRSEKPFREFL